MGWKANQPGCACCHPCPVNALYVVLSDYCAPSEVTVRFQGPLGEDETRTVSLASTQGGVGYGTRFGATATYLNPSDGLWVITVSAAGRHTQTYQVTYGGRCTETTGGVLCPERLTGTFTLRGCAGEPVAGAVLTLRDPAGHAVIAGSTNADGDFTYDAPWPEDKCALTGSASYVSPAVFTLEIVPAPDSGYTSSVENLYMYVPHGCLLNGQFSPVIHPDYVCACFGLVKRIMTVTDKYGSFTVDLSDPDPDQWVRPVTEPQGRNVVWSVDSYGNCVATCVDEAVVVPVFYALRCNGDILQLVKGTTVNCQSKDLLTRYIGPQQYYEPGYDCPGAPVDYPTTRGGGEGAFNWVDGPSYHPMFKSPYSISFTFPAVALIGANQTADHVSGFDDTVTISG